MALEVELVSPERIAYSGEAQMVICRTTTGDIAFLPGHIPFIGVLATHPVRLQLEDGTEQVIAVHQGFVEVSPPAGWVPGATVVDVVPAIVVVGPDPSVRGTVGGFGSASLGRGAGALPGWNAVAAIVKSALALPEILSSTGVAAAGNWNTTQPVAAWPAGSEANGG